MRCKAVSYAPNAFGFADSIRGHEKTFVEASARLEKLQMLDILLAAQIPGVGIERLQLMFRPIFQFRFDFRPRWKIQIHPKTPYYPKVYSLIPIEIADSRSTGLLRHVAEEINKGREWSEAWTAYQQWLQLCVTTGLQSATYRHNEISCTVAVLMLARSGSEVVRYELSLYAASCCRPVRIGLSIHFIRLPSTSRPALRARQ